MPVRLRDCQVVNLQMNTMVAGTMLRGMFEDRIQNVIREIKERPNLILFVDEAHTMVGAGLRARRAVGRRQRVQVGPRARRGPHDRRDDAERVQGVHPGRRGARRAASARVQVAEPTIEETRRILYNLRPRLERNYSVRLLDEAIETALEMSPRYQRHLHLPDKVIGWLDTAAVRAEIDRRWEVTRDDVVEVISHAAQIPKDMVFRDVGDRFKDIESALGKRVIGQKKAVEARGAPAGAEQGPAQGRLRSARTACCCSSARPASARPSSPRPSPSSCSATRRR